MYNFKSVKLFASFILLIGILNSKAGEIPFQKGTLKDALQLAATEKKMVFVDAYTTWCGPCKWMAKNVFTDEKVIQFYEANFICLKLDMEKGEGIEFAKKYDIHAYPTFVFLNSGGTKIHQACGSKEAADFIIDGKNALNPETQLYTLKKNFDSGDRDFKKLKSYAQLLMAANMDGKEVMNELLKNPETENLLSADGFDLLANFSELRNSSFSFLIRNREKFKGIIGIEKWNTFISSLFAEEARAAAKKNTPEKLQEASLFASKHEIENADELSWLMKWEYAQVTKKDLFEIAEQYIPTYKLTDANELNNAAWIIFENYDEPAKLEIAAKWAQVSVELKQDFANTDTYANLLFKLGRLEEAKEAAMKSIDIGKKDAQDIAGTEKLLNEIITAEKSRN
ncbi:MAG: thioredoxin family protein [Bacteroidetes bacterium]|nr:thioredoxin family protein [Bacteroidota bacterium]